jgi:hypothetical protein
MEIALNHSLTYMTKGDVPVDIVARSLLANERLVQESIRILARLAGKDVHVRKVRVRVDYVSNSSPLRQALIATLVLTYQEDLTREVPRLVEMLTGRDVPNNFDTLITVLVMIVAITVIDTAVERLMPGKSLKKLQAELEKKMAQVANLADLDVAEIRRAVGDKLSEGKRKSLFRRAYDFFVPAKLEPDTEIRLDDIYEIPADAIAEIPSELQLDQSDKRNVYDLNGVLVEIHRADVDYQKQGWQAIVDEVSNRRRRLILSPDISPGELYGATTIRGDVMVVEERQIDGEYAVQEYHLIRMDRLLRDDSPR